MVRMKRAHRPFRTVFFAFKEEKHTMKHFPARSLTAVLLLAAILLPSCGAGSSDSSSVTTAFGAASEDTAAETAAETEIPDDLPDEDFGGRDFRIRVTDSFVTRIVIEEETGDVVKDSIYAMNMKVEERFNVDIKAIALSTEDSDISKLKAAILAGDDSCELYTGHDISLGWASLDGLFRNIRALPYLNFDKPWWPSYTVDSLSVGGVMLLFSNYISYYNLASTRCTLFNKAIMNDYGLDYPYDSVRDGTWTLDKFSVMVGSVYDDINGDGQRDYEDLYGMCTSPDLYAIQESFGIRPIVADEDGKLTFDIYNEKTVTLIEKFYKMLYESDGGLVTTEGSTFSKGRSMFIFEMIDAAAGSLRRTDLDYGFAPIPKFDETQETYISGSTDRPYVVPVTATDDELLGIIIEAMSAEDYKIVRPAYFDVALKTKFTYDEDSAEMLDIIGNNIVLDFSYIYSFYGGFAWALMNMMNPDNPSTDFASWYEKNLSSEKNKLANIQQAFDRYLD